MWRAKSVLGLSVGLMVAVCASAMAWAGEEQGGRRAADVYLLNADGKVWKNGAYSEELSTRVKIRAVGVAGSQKMKALPILDASGPVYTNGIVLNIVIPFKIDAVAVAVVGLEMYVLDGSRGEVWRYFREGPAKGQWKREQGKEHFAKGRCVDLAVAGPEEDKVDRKVYLLGANSKVFLDGKEAPGLAPSTGLNKPCAIAVEGEDVYVLDGANGKVYKNGQHDAKLSTSVFVECVGFDVKGGTAYILVKDGGVYVNGQKDPSVSSNVTSAFVGICVK